MLNCCFTEVTKVVLLITGCQPHAVDWTLTSVRARWCDLILLAWLFVLVFGQVLLKENNSLLCSTLPLFAPPSFPHQHHQPQQCIIWAPCLMRSRGRLAEVAVSPSPETALMGQPADPPTPPHPSSSCATHSLLISQTNFSLLSYLSLHLLSVYA